MAMAGSRSHWSMAPQFSSTRIFAGGFFDALMASQAITSPPLQEAHDGGLAKVPASSASTLGSWTPSLWRRAVSFLSMS